MHNSQLVIHESTHSDEQPFTCDKCPQKFKLNGELKRHKKYCGLPKDKKCSVEEDCTHMYCDPRLYNEHIRTKHGNKIFKCEFCDK